MRIFNSWNSWEAARKDLQVQLPEDTIKELTEAFSFAMAYHKTQLRVNEEPFIVHLLQVVEILVFAAGISNKEILLASVLHDVVEDTSATSLDISNKFGANVAALVEWLTIPKAKDGEDKEQIKDEHIHKLFSAPMDAIIIKLADRYSNVQMLYKDPRPNKRMSFYIETISDILPLAKSHPVFVQLFDEWRKEYEYLLEHP